jgi:hypothetical protein
MQGKFERRNKMQIKQPGTPERERPKGRVKSFFADNALDRRIRMMAADKERDESWVMRKILREYFGLKPTGEL